MKQSRSNTNFTIPSRLAATLTAPVPEMHEYSIRLAEKSNKQYDVMKFNNHLNVDFDKWSSVVMGRENNLEAINEVGADKEPKFGAGSVYNRKESRKEKCKNARRKKYDIDAKKYNPDAPPWILDDGNKKFRGTREGGVDDHSSYYVFAQNEDGTITAHKLEEWHSFQPINRFKHLSSEQAEEEFAKREKCVNKWSMMLKMQLNANTNGEEAEEAEKTKSKKGSKLCDEVSSLKISDMDEFMHSSDESSCDDENDNNREPKIYDGSDNETKAEQKEAKVKAALANKKKNDRDLDKEAGEESDDGDQEGKERDYIESSDSDLESELIFLSDSDSDNEKTDKFAREIMKPNNINVSLINEVNEDKENRSEKDIFNGAMNKTPGCCNKSNFRSDMDLENVEPTENKKKINGKKSKSIDKRKSKDNKYQSKSQLKALTSSAANTLLVADASNKRKASSPPLSLAKKVKIEALAPVSTPLSNYSSNELSEEAVRQFLLRKPMTTTEIISKFKKLKTKISNKNLVSTMSIILKKINPNKQTIQGKMYLSLTEM